jgi:HEAT repeat protein
MTTGARRVALVAAVLSASPLVLAAGAFRAPWTAWQDSAPAGLSATIEQLGSLDFKTRTTAAQAIRRMTQASVVPSLVHAAQSNADGYVRYQALVLLSGFGPDSASGTMRALMGDKNDRLRAVAYGWFEHHPQPDVLSTLVAAIATEESEFVRPALTRAIAASGDEPRVTATLVPLIRKGVNFFRSGVMEALGDYRSKSAVPGLLESAGQDGPLQADAIEALGKVGDRSVAATLAPMESTVPQVVQPAVAAALCNLNIDCTNQIHFIVQMLAAAAPDASRAALTEASAHALAVLAVSDKPGALPALLELGEGAKEPARSPVALAVGYVALRKPSVIVQAVQAGGNRPASLALLRDAFDILSDEDFERECFYAEVRRIYWGAPEGSAERQTAQAIINALEF